MANNTRTVDFDISVGTNIIGVFERLEIDTLHAFCEFIDNSLQSFRDHENELRKVGVKKCIVEIEWGNDEICIRDNAYGMEEESFGRALRLNAPKSSYEKGSLSKYGMGLKYGAINLGGVWSIQSTELGSTNKYHGTIDSNEMIFNNINTIKATVSETSKDEHKTVITIKNLKRRFVSREQDDIIHKLSIVYETFLAKNYLDIYINANKVTYHDPEFQENPKTGVPYFNSISNGKFVFNEKTYEYTATIGILKVGNVKGAGLRLRQNDRVIQLSYRPTELFGQANDFRYQRVVGNVDFIGDEWIVKINKDGMAWKTKELEQAFIEDLNSRDETKRIMATAKAIRSRDSYKISHNVINANVELEKSKYKADELVTFTVKPHTNYKVTSVSINGEELTPEVAGSGKYSFVIKKDFTNALKIKVKTEFIPNNSAPIPSNRPGPLSMTPQPPPVLPEPQETIEEYAQKTFRKLVEYSIPEIPEEGSIYSDGIIVKTKDSSYSFIIRENDNPTNNNWFEMKDKKPFVRTYEITINIKAGILRNLVTNETTKKLVIVYAISLALSRIVAKAKCGLEWKESAHLINSLNEIIGKLG